MRISVPTMAFGLSKAKFIVAAMATLMLSGCSDSIERFSANYSNPSDSDPVYTASVPKYKKITRRPISQKYVASNEEVIVQSPIASTPLRRPKIQSYDYTKSYQNYQQPKLAYTPPSANIAPPMLKAPSYKAPTLQAPTYKQPDLSASADEAITDAPVPAAPKKFAYKQVASAAPTAPLYKQPTAIVPVQPVYKQNTALQPQGSYSTVTVGDGMTLYGIARANHMTVDQLAAANHLKKPYSVSPGQVLRVPGSHSAALSEAASPAPKVKAVSLAEEEQAPAPTPKPTKGGGSYVVATGDTLYSIGRHFGVAPFSIADLNGLPHNKPLALGQSLRIPKGAAQSVANASPAQSATPPEPIADANSAPDTVVANAGAPAKKPGALSLTKDTASEQVATADASSGLTLRWPLKGKVISAFGPKPNGLKNEGINIAVPEGTNIQAAEGGVVAYAGNELKGYGNLVLVRHAGGYVTAYAHASQLLVKRGDTVKRGDVIAKAGQTGAVQSPQLHFEVRKGATALDPYKFLGSSTAMN